MGLITRGVFTYILNVITILAEEDNPFSVDSFHAVSPWYSLLNFSNRFYIFQILNQLENMWHMLLDLFLLFFVIYIYI